MLAAIIADVSDERQAAGAANGAADSGERPSLSSREVEVLRYLVQGMANKEIAANLGLSESTVKNALEAAVLQDRRADAKPVSPCCAGTVSDVALATFSGADGAARGSGSSRGSRAWRPCSGPARGIQRNRSRRALFLSASSMAAGNMNHENAGDMIFG